MADQAPDPEKGLDDDTGRIADVATALRSAVLEIPEKVARAVERALMQARRQEGKGGGRSGGAGGPGDGAETLSGGKDEDGASLSRKLDRARMKSLWSVAPMIPFGKDYARGQQRLMDMRHAGEDKAEAEAKYKAWKDGLDVGPKTDQAAILKARAAMLPPDPPPRSATAERFPRKDNLRDYAEKVLGKPLPKVPPQPKPAGKPGELAGGTLSRRAKALLGQDRAVPAGVDRGAAAKAGAAAVPASKQPTEAERKREKQNDELVRSMKAMTEALERSRQSQGPTAARPATGVGGQPAGAAASPLGGMPTPQGARIMGQGRGPGAIDPTFGKAAANAVVRRLRGSR